MKPLTLVLAFITLLGSCGLLSCEEAHLNERTYEKNGITASSYQISLITSMHDYVDISRWGFTENVFKCSVDHIYDILIDKDTVVIRTREDPYVYKVTGKTLWTYIKIDSSITTERWMRRYRPAFSDSAMDVRCGRRPIKLVP